MVLLMVAQLTKTFLTMMQSVKPMIHLLLSAAGEMFRAIARVIVKSDKISDTLVGIKAMKLILNYTIRYKKLISQKIDLESSINTQIHNLRQQVI